MKMLPRYKEVSDRRLKGMSAEDKLEEIKKAFKILQNTIPPKPEDLIEGMYKKLEPPFNKCTIERLEFNHSLYIYFADIVQRMI